MSGENSGIGNEKEGTRELLEGNGSQGGKKEQRSEKPRPKSN